jgi:hypothetical protein
MIVFELEEALVEFITQNTREYLFYSNEESDEMVPPAVWSGYIPRDQVGAVIPGDISTYPAIIVNSRRGTQLAPPDSEREIVEVEILIGCFDKIRDQQGFRDCMNIVQKLKDRFREQDWIRERFPLRLPLKWEVNRFYGGGTSNYFPYFFGDMFLQFELPVMASQYDVDISTPDWTQRKEAETTGGRLDEAPYSLKQPKPLEIQEDE